MVWEEKYPVPSSARRYCALKKHHLFEDLTALKLSKDRPKRRTKRLRGYWIEGLSHRGVARDVLNSVDGGQIPLDPLFVKGQEGGCFEGKHGKPRHKGIR